MLAHQDEKYKKLQKIVENGDLEGDYQQLAQNLNEDIDNKNYK